jgi:hypothetical protein
MDDEKLQALAREVERQRARLLELEARDHQREAALIEIREILEERARR